MPQIIEHDNFDREGPGHDDELIAQVSVWTAEADRASKVGETALSRMLLTG